MSHNAAQPVIPNFYAPGPGKEQCQITEGRKVSYKIKTLSDLSAKLNRGSSLLTFQVFYFCLICCYLRLTKTPCFSNINPLFLQNSSSHSSLALPQ